MLQAMREGIGRWLAIVILSLIAFGFIFFGIDFTGTTTNFAARVNGEEIALFDFERTLQNQLSEYQRVYPIELNDDLRRQIRANLIENMVRELVVEQAVRDRGYRASDASIAAAIRADETFHVGGEFDSNVYRRGLASIAVSPPEYEEQVRLRLAVQDLQDGLTNSTFLTPSEFRTYIELARQQREIAYATFSAADMTADLEISDEDIASYYEANAPLYLSAESVDFEYVEIALADITAATSVTEEELREYYQNEIGLFETEEERSVRHILIDESDAAAANSRATEILARLDAGEAFEDLAAEVSDDPGTRTQGGDLGRIARGMLSGPFEDAVFSMAEGEVRGPVRSDFGVHIIRLDSIESGDTQSFDNVREDLLSRLQTQRAEDSFYDLAETLADRAYYNEGDLAGIAAELMLPLISVTEFERSGNAEMFDNSVEVVQAAFSDEVLNQGRNSDLIELDDDHVLVLRVTDHHEPRQLSLDEVRDTVIAEIAAQRGAESAQAAAAAFSVDAETAELDALAALAEQHGGKWQAPLWIQRDNAALPVELVTRVFAMQTPPVGTVRWERVFASGGDEIVVQLRAVEAGQPELIPREERDRLQLTLGERSGVAELAAYATSIREDARVTIPDIVLEPVF